MPAMAESEELDKAQIIRAIQGRQTKVPGDTVDGKQGNMFKHGHKTKRQARRRESAISPSVENAEMEDTDKSKSEAMAGNAGTT